MKEPSDFPVTSRRQVGPGTRLNGIYEIDGLIATGGMGEVYRGRAIETGIKVAIKMIRAELTENETVLALFKKEAAALHNLQHDAVVRYYVFSTDPDLGCPYLAMEYVEGVPLSDMLQQGAMGLDAVRILQRRVASALEVAHVSGVVHRDMSPDNIILPNGNPTRAKIIDFGIARSAFGGGTIIGDRFAGKANFASPEQVGLFGAEAGPASDIYSLGLVLAAALLGSPLDMGGTQLDVIRKRQSVPDLAAIDPSIRPLIAWMLRPDPADRPPSMAAVASWSPHVEPPTVIGPVAVRQRNWVPLAAAGIVAFGIAVGLIGSRFLPWTSEQKGSSTPAVATQSRVEEPQRPDIALLPPSPQVDTAPSAREPEAAPSPPIVVARPPDLPTLRIGPPGSESPAAQETPGASAQRPSSVPADPPPSPAPVVGAAPVSSPTAADTVPPATLPNGGTFRECPTCPVMVVIPPGRFRMGGSDPTERPVREVSVPRFAASRFPVTAIEWRRCFNDRGCSFDPGGDPDAPVHNVSFNDAAQFIAWLSRTTGQPYRFLTEAEWEYTARAGTGTRYWWGDQFRKDLAACKGCSDTPLRTPPKTGTFRENGFGLFDVTGSVAQWVQDCWHPSYRGAPKDASAWIEPGCRERVLRGGSWMNEPADLRIASRSLYDATVRYPGHGFRVARDM